MDASWCATYTPPMRTRTPHGHTQRALIFCDVGRVCAVGVQIPHTPSPRHVSSEDLALASGPMEESGNAFNSYFSVESGRFTKIFYFTLLGITIVYSTICLLDPFIRPDCDVAVRRRMIQGLEGGLEDAPNPSYTPDPCRWIRYWVLLGMNPWEADMSRRIVMSILMGSIIGFERRRVDRPAGIRTMAMVCLGA